MSQSSQNRLLEMMPSADLAQLRPHLHEVTFNYKMPLYEADEPIRNVHFPIKGVASLVKTMEDGFAAEVGTVGNEGVIGVPIRRYGRADQRVCPSARSWSKGQGEHSKEPTGTK